MSTDEVTCIDVDCDVCFRRLGRGEDGIDTYFDYLREAVEWAAENEESTLAWVIRDDGRAVCPTEDEEHQLARRFAKLEFWRPGPGFRTAIPGRSWWRPDGRSFLRRYIVAVAIVWPKEAPAHDGGQWTEDELWTVRLPLETDDTFDPEPGNRFGSGAEYMLHDKPHRLSWWAEGERGRRILDRRPATEGPDWLTYGGLMHRLPMEES